MLLASDGWEERLRLWDPVVGRAWPSVPGLSFPDCNFSHDGRIVLSQGDSLTTYQVEPALEFRTLAHDSAVPMEYGAVTIRHDGRVLAAGTNQGVVLWDLARGTELAFLPIGFAWHSMFEASGDLLTSGVSGVHRWPVRLDAQRGEFRIGPPHRLPLPPDTDGIAEDSTGRIVALAGEDTAYVAPPGACSGSGRSTACASSPSARTGHGSRPVAMAETVPGSGG